MKRFFDIFISSVLLIVLIPIFCIISLLIKVFTSDSIIFWSKRMGENNIIFNMPKFRTMRIDAPQMATHLIDNPSSYYTSIGLFLRRYSLDELPQLISIFIGKMSLIGPRPALFNQYDLIKMREAKNIHQLKPGLTGWAQVNGRDDISLIEKVEFDYEYLKNRSLFFDLSIIWLTFIKVIKKEDISH